ncbi:MULTISPECIES: AAA family ATPase [Vibrio]|uniref:AAA family ATPase n=1 Tax=Vibrio TaxID=662 RepID=UPI001882594C|nr:MULTISPECIES: AAA family ATPase [Vibrio]EJM7152612.1 AAA family ATPase [Vibrio parahaemolyticus]MBE8568382.1 AAA family ATPase [Vibrio sp. OPT46]MBE8580582.1 AAA family ATPase [Vibrio sp. OPT41]MCQ9061325.1 AAA family ATPase [Vibrio alginolyticus]MCS0396992.1 AAA family ATPase [Vibrio diabolicus]
MKIVILSRNQRIPSSGVNTAYLIVDHWNDFSFVTMFYLSLYDQKGELHEIGNVKIGFQGQSIEKSTYSTLGGVFDFLPEGYFSVGQDVDYYQKISNLSEPVKVSLLKALKDIAHAPALIEIAQDEDVFRTSLLRDVSLSVIKGQFTRVLEGKKPLTNFEFKFVRPDQAKMSGIELTFKVKVEDKPSSNIHAIIGRNGVGKTTLLNGMIEAVTGKGQPGVMFYDIEGWREAPISKDYFSSLVSVSFSAFDPFSPPTEQPDPSKGTCYFYIGLKKGDDSLKGLNDIHEDFLQALKSCLSQTPKRDRWLKAIDTLESDENFAGMGLKELVEYSGEVLTSKARKRIKKMSSGHAVVLLTITRLVATVEEKTLVLIDEPESHLHPPLLSAFIRALSDLLLDRNGVSIIATHSPVVLQEVPRCCVWKINRCRLVTEPRRPAIETFGENVGILTREVFGLEVVKSGFHDLLAKSVASGDTYEEIVGGYRDQLGVEARALLKALVVHRDRGEG